MDINAKLMMKCHELEAEVEVLRAENKALHEIIQEFRDELTAVETQLNLMVRDRTYVAR